MRASGKPPNKPVRWRPSMARRPMRWDNRPGRPGGLPRIPIKAIPLKGSYVGNLRETQELLDLVRTRKIAPIPVTPMPLAKANEALVDLQQGKLVGRAG